MVHLERLFPGLMTGKIRAMNHSTLAWEKETRSTGAKRESNLQLEAVQINEFQRFRVESVEI